MWFIFQYAIALSLILSGCHASDLGGYAPVRTHCPRDLKIRPASDGLSPSEKAWRNARSEQMVPALRAYLNLVDIPGLNVETFVQSLDTSTVPIVGMSISGGGTQAGMGGLGVYQAFDSRYPPAVNSHTGGIAQIMSYVTGLSGGGAVAVSLVAANNFTAVEDIRRTANFSVRYDTGPTRDKHHFYENILSKGNTKVDTGFAVTVADIFGQFWGIWLPENQTHGNWSDLASADTAFTLGKAPMPIVTFSEVVPGVSPEIDGIMSPGLNATNGFNLTSYEISPYEFGSWVGGRVQAFMPTKYLGTAMSNGSAANESQCVKGFDKYTFIQGTTADAFPGSLIDVLGELNVFSKRQAAPRSDLDLDIPTADTDNSKVRLVRLTAQHYGQTFNESLWGTCPNPFQDYNEAMEAVGDLLLADGSLAGEQNPIRPLITPGRNVDFIIAFEASGDAQYNWVNGSSLINSARAAKEGGLPFPPVPLTVSTMVNQNLTRQPTFFGCNDSSVPLLLYLPNSPWTAYSNYSKHKSSFADAELDLIFDNSYQLATYGNGSIDAQWPVCLACATIRGSMHRLAMDQPEACKRCFGLHCWSGEESMGGIAGDAFNWRPRLNHSLTFQAWNNTTWADARREANEDSKGVSRAMRGTWAAAGYALLAITAVAYLL